MVILDQDAVEEPHHAFADDQLGLALEQGKVRPDTVIETAGGKLTIATATISDAHALGNLTVAQVIQKSSNVGTVKMAMQMEPREMWEVFSAAGFGQKPQLEFPGAVGGRLRPHRQVHRVAVGRWSGVHRSE